MAITDRACVDCQRWMVPMKNGVAVLETMEDGVTPYKIWIADLWSCPGCFRKLITGFAGQPLAIHHMEGFTEYLEEVKATAPFYTIRGCPGAPIPYDGSGGPP